MKRRSRSRGPRLSRWAMALALCLPGLLWAETEPPATQTAPAPPTIADLAWMQGHWQATFGGTQLEEYWSEPLGDCMMGAFRWVNGGKVTLFELLTIVQEEDALVLRLKHFGRDLAGHEEKDEAWTYPLARVQDREAVFENPERDSPRRFIYRRTGEDTLLIRLEAYRGEQVRAEDIPMRRKGAPAP